jgi:uncharacterized protein YjiK
MINVNKNNRRSILSRQILLWGFGVLMLAILLFACKRRMIVLKSPPRYNFSMPEIIKLDARLKNISGIAWDKKKNFFFAIEEGSDQLYKLSQDTKKIIQTYSLGEKGSYKDLAIVDTIPYILQNDGTIFKCVTDSSGSAALVQIGKLQSGEEEEFESMFYDPGQKALIIIGKTSSRRENNKINAYAFYMDSTGFSPKPIFQINVSVIDKLAPRESPDFEPTAAALNPVLQKIFILSASSRQLVVAGSDGKVESVYVLIPSMFPQPEGICFRSNGDMYIMNKGGSGRATMLKFAIANKIDDKSVTKPAYDFSKPDAVMELGKHLREISGISYSPDQDIMLAENDEKGEIFKVDFKNKKDDFDKIKFGGPGDYEDIVHTDTADYLLISSGTIVQVLTKNGDITGVKKFTLIKSGSNEYETLYPDTTSHSLIMLCKQCAHEKDKVRSAFRFDLVTQKFSDEPVYEINIDIIRMQLDDPTAAFKPSAAAINPVTGKLFVVASVGKLLVIADKNGNVEKVFRLDPKLFNQPEGMTFAPNGDLYISNEGGDGAATILKFIYKP